MISLPNAMCLDRHVPDFLSCLQCWLQRTFGDPNKTLKPWRLLSLDLSRNSLSDESVRKVVGLLKTLDLRLEVLKLAGNCVKDAGLAIITEFIWNCKDALVEIDLSENDIVAEPSGEAAGSDVVSGLLRCFYNHSAYPLLLRDSSEQLQAVPVILRLGGNFISNPAKLLKQIRSNGGRDHVQIRATPDPYPHVDKEYLSACLPGFLTQRTDEKTSPPTESMVLQVQKPASETNRRGRSRSERKRRRRDAEGEIGDGKKKPVLSEEEQNRLQANIDAKLLSLSSETEETSQMLQPENRQMLAEFAVCNVIARRNIKEIEEELGVFLSELTGPFLQWFEAHLRSDFPQVTRWCFPSESTQ